MKMMKRAIAATELALIFPSALFMTALFVRNLQPLQYEPAHTAQQIVTWYAMRPRTGLWLLLMALPAAVLLIGCGALVRSWKNEAELRQALRESLRIIHAHVATLLVAGATLTAAGILAIVALHLITG